MGKYDFKNDDELDTDQAHREISDRFDTNSDPLRDLASEFEDLSDPFELFVKTRLSSKNPSKNTLMAYETAFNQFHEFMSDTNRHHACANHRHIKEWVGWLRTEHGNRNRTIGQKLGKIGSVYEYLRDHDDMPHPPDYDPIDLAVKELDLEVRETPDFPDLSKEQVAAGLERIKHVRDRTMALCQLKLAMRATPVSNMRLEDVSMANSDLREHYPSLGTHPKVEDKDNAVWIPPRTERDGNKSYKGRVLPLDEEMRRWLRAYLMVRPINDEGWLFLSKSHHQQVSRNQPNEAWHEGFEQFRGNDDDLRDVTSHFGRHFFTRWWDTEHQLKDTLIKYMRGDKFRDNDGKKHGIDHYRRVEYEDIEDIYRRKVFKFGI